MATRPLAPFRVSRSTHRQRRISTLGSLHPRLLRGLRVTACTAIHHTVLPTITTASLSHTDQPPLRPWQRTKPAVSGVEGRRALAVALQVMDQIKEHQKLDLFQNFLHSKKS